MNNYATVDDVRTLLRSLSTDEETRCAALLPIISAALRQEAAKVGKDLDEMVQEESMELVAKGVTVDIVARALNSNTSAEPLSQMSESAMGYTVSGTYLIPGGGTIQILNNDLKKLGLKRQKIGVISLC